ncbi:hypothetical protein ACFPIF_00010 [Brevundimonas faecalis]|uniref:hypothetical protein n=1 Tax=Brevundimonas faecalis TaxID=947378 RepID=UPI003613992A
MMLPELRAEALRPATHAEIIAIIRSREQTFGDLRTARSEGEWAAFWADYFDTLEGLTAASIEAGMAAYVAQPDSQWAPKPGRLAHLAKTTTSTGKFVRAYNRARSAVLKHQQANAPAQPAPAEYRPEEVKAMVAQVKSAMAETPTAKMMTARRAAMKPTPAAPLPAGSHMSAEMRAKLEERGAIPRAEPSWEAAA